MRLTLRTLLAYLDDTLEPAATKEIGAKLSETESAQELASKIREVTRRRRLSAPPPDGGEIDANEAAEYLDNLLPPARTSEVERLCLGSDVSLADIATCHQILTMIGQPANVTPQTRDKMYRLVSSIESVPASHRKFPEKPAETLPLPERTVLARLVGGIAIAAGVLLVVILSVQSFPKGLFTGETEVAENEPKPGSDQPGDDKPFVPSTVPEQPDLEELDFQTPVTGKSSKDSSDQASAEPDETTELAPEPSGPESNPGPATDAVPDSKPEPEPEPVEAGNPPAQPAAESNEPDAAAETVEAPPAPVALGQYTSLNGILMHAGSKGESQWTRMTPAEVDQSVTVNLGQPLLCLPSYRAVIQTETGHTVELVGETEVDFEAPDEGIDVQINLDRGRLILSANEADTAFRVKFQDQVWTIQLTDSRSVIGFEVSSPWTAGVTTNYRAELLVPDGEAELVVGESSQTLGAPVYLEWSESGGLAESKTLTTPPAWLTRQRPGLLRVKASEELASIIPPEESPVLRLVEFASQQKTQPKRLALECLAAIGKLEPVIEMLGAVEGRETRQIAIETLRAYLARGPMQDLLLRQALTGRGPDADLKPEERVEGVVSLLRGFSPEQAKLQITYESLISLLDSRYAIAIRELAITNLKDLTGKDLDYDPDRVNENALQKWRRQLDQGRLPPRKRP